MKQFINIQISVILLLVEWHGRKSIFGRSIVQLDVSQLYRAQSVEICGYLKRRHVDVNKNSSLGSAMKRIEFEWNEINEQQQRKKDIIVMQSVLIKIDILIYHRNHFFFAVAAVEISMLYVIGLQEMFGKCCRHTATCCPTYRIENIPRKVLS